MTSGLLFPPCGYEFDTHTDIQNEFIKQIEKQGIDEAIEWLKTVKNGELSYPRALVFRWNGSPGDEFEISKNKDFSNSRHIKCDLPSCEIDNLEIGCEYFWRVNKGDVFNFHTQDNSFRFIRIEGALNVRDLGGKNIKQGIIYRGSDIDTTYKISDTGRKTFCDVLNIKSEIELREDADSKKESAAGPKIIRKYLPYRPYEEVFEEKHKREICEIMKFLADENNYPVYVHCLGGADRTGMIAFYLRALAGECDEDIYIDYELTSLSTYAYGLTEGAGKDGFRSRKSIVDFLDMLDVYAPGKSLSEKVKSFLMDCGVSNEVMNRIINNIKR